MLIRHTYEAEKGNYYMFLEVSALGLWPLVFKPQTSTSDGLKSNRKKKGSKTTTAKVKD